MKKYLLLLLVVLIALPAMARDFQYSYEGETLTYTVLDEEAKTCATKAGYVRQGQFTPGNYVSGSLNIPEHPKDGYIEYTLTEIGDCAFSGCSSLTSVNIPNSVVSISKYAFESCSNLTSVNIPNSVTSIGQHAFTKCSGLTSVNIPNSVKKISIGAFAACSGLKSVIIPNSVTSIGQYAFTGCSGLTSVNISNSLTSIDENTFSGCSSLTSISIPKSVTSIGRQAFSRCSRLTSVTIPSSVTEIREGAFTSCERLKNVEFASIEHLCNIKFGGDYANPLIYTHHLYIDGAEITNLVIPNSVTKIGDYAFDGCSFLTSVTISHSITSIGSHAFRGCDGLKNAEFASIEHLCNIKFGGNYANPLIYTHHLYIDGAEITNLVIPNSVTEIGNYAFNECSFLTSVTIPSSVTSIGDKAFSGCSSLTSISIPKSVTSIGFCAFLNCDGLKNAEFASIEHLCNIKFGGDYANPLIYIHHLYIDGAEITNLVIPNSVTEIGNYTFYGCSGLRSVSIPNSITTIGHYAFLYCSGLTSVIIPNSVTSIGDYAFSGCSSLASVSIPNSITSIGNYAFSDCSSLASVSIPNSITSIGNYAFSGCSSLASVSIPNSVKHIGDGTFYDCSGLTSINIPNSVISIHGSAFYRCSALVSVIIPNSVTSISYGAFNGCSSLKEAAYPSTISGNPFETGVGKVDKILQYPAEGAIIEDGCVFGSEKSALYFVSCYTNGEFVVPNSVIHVGNNAFYYCSGITSVVFTSALTEFERATMFIGCDGLRKGAYPSEMENPFPNYCMAICYDDLDSRIEDGFVYSRRKNKLYFAPLEVGPHFTVYESVTEITDNAFYGCTELEDITLPKNLSTLGENVWKGCTAIKNIVYKGDAPIEAPTNIFDKAAYDNATLYVGKGKRELFQSSEPWGFFYNISEEEYSGIDEDCREFNATAALEVCDIYTLQGICVKRNATAEEIHALPGGLYIVGGRKVFIK